MFVHGRTETIRSCSNESMAFVKAMMTKSTDQDIITKLNAAVQSHKEYSSAAVQGSGVDRHILGLKLIAKENNIPLPQFFCDPSLSISSHWNLSTSQVNIYILSLITIKIKINFLFILGRLTLRSIHVLRSSI